MPIPTSSPSAQGVAPEAILALLDALDADDRIEPHGLIISRHGTRVVEGYWAPHTAERTRLVYSLSKAFTGAALGLAVGEGLLSLDDPVHDHIPEAFDGADPRARRLRVRHLASMATGHDRETLLEAFALDPTDVVAAFLRIPPDHEPGTIFAYNQPPVMALAAILQRRSGERLSDYLRARLLDPMGVADLRWAQYAPGIDLGFSGVYTNLDAVARLGQLHLDDGLWGGRRLLPAGWVAEASRPQVANPDEPEPDWQQGYGHLLWMSRHGYRGDGAFGQLMVVLPDCDAVVAILSATEHMQELLDLLWTHLLPAMGASARPAGPADDDLAQRLASLSLPTARERVGASSPRPRKAWLRPGPPGERTHRTISGVEVDHDILVVREGDTSLHLPLRSAWTVAPDAPIATSAAQDATGRIAVDLAFLDTPHRLELVLDPASSSFDATWPAVPLFGAGIGSRLADMRAPTDGALA